MKKSFKRILDEVRAEPDNFVKAYEQSRFDIRHLDASSRFKNQLDLNTRIKIDDVTRNAAHRYDPKLLKKLTKDIWEFRIRHQGLQYRFLWILEKN